MHCNGRRTAPHAGELTSLGASPPSGDEASRGGAVNRNQEFDKGWERFFCWAVDYWHRRGHELFEHTHE